MNGQVTSVFSPIPEFSFPSNTWGREKDSIVLNLDTKKNKNVIKAVVQLFVEKLDLLWT